MGKIEMGDRGMKVLKGILFYLGMIIGILCMFKFFVFYMPFLVGFMIAELLEPFIRFLMKKMNLVRKTSSIIIIFTFFMMLILILFLGGTFILSETTNFLSNFNEYINSTTEFINNFSKYINLDRLNINREIKNIFENTAIDFVNQFAKTLKNALTKILSGITILPKIFIYIIITILATYFIASDKFYILDQLEYHFPKKWVVNLREISKNIFSSLASYLKAEAIMIFISFIVVLIGLSTFYFIGLNIKYPLLIAILIGFVDSLPILGSGTIIIPWAVVCFANKDITLGSSLIGLYIFNLLIKQLIEPKIVSSNIGIHPIYTLISMYTGFKFLGIIGLLVGPIVLIILKNIFSNVLDKGLTNSVIEKS